MYLHNDSTGAYNVEDFAISVVDMIEIEYQ